ncbi:alpha-mannosidase 2C1-like isoform X2 [Oscarella lobularis]|uniref:alpha-mannosidase 2C1-like isoform X2 n=1 Tax=Oscarella lobularis TaxID=121494 RepID=UPI003314352A
MEAHVVQKHKRCTLERIEKFLSPIYFVEANLKGRLYRDSAPLLELRHHCSADRISYEEATGRDFKETHVGHAFGKTWTTHWFKIRCRIPDDWKGEEVRLRWDSGSEAMIWIDGEPVQGLNGGDGQARHDFILSKKSAGGENFILYIEMAACGMFGAGCGSMIAPPDGDRLFTLSKADIVVFDRECYNLIIDLSIMHDLAKELPESDPSSWESLYLANEIINQCNPFDRQTFSRCRQMAREFFSRTRENSSRFTVVAVGNCHIDCAWLWPYGETIRKCARSWSSALRLMDDYPDFVFVASQAQQFEWVKLNYPSLYQKIVSKSSAGKFVPVGGTWIEMDGNLPSGESFIRQFLVGQRFFREEFGKYCSEFWLPDTFGYSGQLPQIMRKAGIRNFLTQKLSWNLTNKFPHSTFMWEGIDGSSCLVHFPPADTYGSDASVHDIIKSQTNMKDLGRSSHSLLLYGYGDGGGGPNEDMLERLERLKSVAGCPNVELSTVDSFFEGIEKRNERRNLVDWVGELYLELHRGTYTTQAQTKLANRRGEILLHDVEMFATIGSLLKGFAYPRSELLRVWKLLLLNQFHDVLPGSSIGKVYADAMAYYEDVQTTGTKILNEACASLFDTVVGPPDISGLLIVNTLPWERQEIVALPRCVEGRSPAAKRRRSSLSSKWQSQVATEDESILVAVSVPSLGYAKNARLSCLKKVDDASLSIDEKNGFFILSNGILKATIDSGGRLVSCVLLATNRDAVSPGTYCNQFVLFDDIPLYWDAWDVMEYHLETRAEAAGGMTEAMDRGPLRVSVQTRIPLSERSHIVQTVYLDAGSPSIKFQTKESEKFWDVLSDIVLVLLLQVDWHESHKFLKVEFPLDVRSTQATYEIQMGHLQRPTHYNTSWDQARFEVCAHKWADLSEHGFGVALLNDCKYGYSTHKNVMRLSLLRSSKSPDSEADMGEHVFTYSLMPHEGDLQSAGVIREAYSLNFPLRCFSVTDAEDGSQSYFRMSEPGIVLETIKQAEERPNCVVVRLYEAFGGQRKGELWSFFEIESAWRSDLLEDDLEPLLVQDGRHSVELVLKPFEIVTILLDLGNERN